MKLLRTIPLLILLSSCANDSGSPDKTAAAEPAHRTLQQRLNEKNGYKQDASGNWIPQNDRRSSFEAQGESPYFKGNLAKSEYHAGEYARKAWWGSTAYNAKAYGGKTDGNRFLTQNRNANKTARDANRQAAVQRSYQTPDYQTSQAREGSREISKQSDAETDERRRVFTPPAVVDWQAQRSMSVEESRNILGR